MRQLMFFLLVFALFVGVPIAAAEGEIPVDPTNLAAVLGWLAGAGAAYVVNLFLLSLADVVWPAWNDLHPMVQNLVKGALIVIIALGAHQLGTQTAFLEQAGPIWAIVIGALMGGWVSERQHTHNVRMSQAVQKIRRTLMPPSTAGESHGFTTRRRTQRSRRESKEE